MGEVADGLARQGDDALTALLARASAHRDAALTGAYADRRVADALTHLHAWHVLLEGWVVQHLAGVSPAYPAEGFTWERLDALNDALYRAHRHRGFDEARMLLGASHLAAVALLRELDEDTLTSPAATPWLGGMPLAEVAHECLAGHYAWAEDLLDRSGVPAA